ncbi:hypothetical protein P7F88_17940 [Vibrio hannami]|uniref:hypothetical protein n=1 Tax=Vibrio hannami TaxID=2717094 RepID=UPI00240F84BC|nr:hypothetical protein [Vibrio hannami]MDG3087848.1 hypothetical protein [Vibrio hannami]
MSTLTTEQEIAIATLKENLHLPGNGFHSLIIAQCKKYQLPFQAVRTVFMQSQTSIESQIRTDFDALAPEQLTFERWFALIEVKLSDMAKSNVPVMESLKTGKRYQELQSLLTTNNDAAPDQEQINNLLEDIYEFEVAKPLKAMLRTTKLFWSVKNSLFEMTTEQREKFSDYPQHMEAIEHLLSLAD